MYVLMGHYTHPADSACKYAQVTPQPFLTGFTSDPNFATKFSSMKEVFDFVRAEAVNTCYSKKKFPEAVFTGVAEVEEVPRYKVTRLIQ